jgi:prepilin peptidase CpaA
VSLDIAALLLFAAFALYGAYLDIRFRTIPNVLNIVMAVAGLGAAWMVGGSTAAAYGLAHFAVALAAGMAIYALGLWGGGDAKFYAASAAWFELWAFPRLALAIALAGLGLLVVWFGARQVRGSPKQDGGKKELPYGVAIAVGGISAAMWGLGR